MKLKFVNPQLNLCAEHLIIIFYMTIGCPSLRYGCGLIYCYFFLLYFFFFSDVFRDILDIPLPGQQVVLERL